MIVRFNGETIAPFKLRYLIDQLRIERNRKPTSPQIVLQIHYLSLLKEVLGLAGKYLQLKAKS